MSRKKISGRNVRAIQKIALRKLASSVDEDLYSLYKFAGIFSAVGGAVRGVGRAAHAVAHPVQAAKQFGRAAMRPENIKGAFHRGEQVGKVVGNAALGAAAAAGGAAVYGGAGLAGAAKGAAQAIAQPGINYVKRHPRVAKGLGTAGKITAGLGAAALGAGAVIGAKKLAEEHETVPYGSRRI